MGNERREGQLKTTLIIMAKPPVLGLVKTRLAASVGDEMALKVYFELLAFTFSQAFESKIETAVHFSQSTTFVDDFSLFEKHIQRGDDLGQRILESFSKELTSADACLMIGADCPDLSGEILQQAEKALEQNDLVLGPSDDGGYYLIGLKKANPALFKNVAWSTESVLRSTMENADKLEWKAKLLPELFDIDDIEDLKRSRFSALAVENRNLADAKGN